MKKSYQNGTTKHDDRNVTSSLLNVHLSFHWRPMLGQDLFQTVENWLADDESTPDFVLIGKQSLKILELRQTRHRFTIRQG